MRILVTGAARGLGAALMEEGMRRGHDMAGGVRAEGYGEPGRLLLPMDVTNGEQVKQAADELTRRWGTLDVLINNAGVIQPDFDSYFAPGRCAVIAAYRRAGAADSGELCRSDPGDTGFLAAAAGWCEAADFAHYLRIGQPCVE